MEPLATQRMQSSTTPPGKLVGDYALYTYNTNRSMDSVLETSTEADRSVAELLNTEARSNVDFSLDVVCTSLPVEQEQSLRAAIIMNLSKGCVYSGSGNVFNLSGTGAHLMTSTLVYFCVVREDAPQSNAKATASDVDSASAGVAPVVHVDGDVMSTVVEPVDDPAATSALDTSYYASDHVVCFIKQVRVDGESTEMDLFRPEMDQYVAKLSKTSVLAHCQLAAAVVPDADASRDDTAENISATAGDRASAARMQLAKWHARTVDYLPRCVRLLSKRLLGAVIEAALLGQRVELVGDTSEELLDDIARFIRGLSPSSLLHYPGASMRSQLDSTALGFLAAPSPLRLQQAVRDDGSTVFEAAGDSLPPSAFCQRWASAMLAVDTDPSALKTTVQNNVHKVIQEINRMKRLMDLAEMSHYALYNAERYLQSCNTPVNAILLHSVDTTAAPAARDAVDVVSVIIEYQLTRGSSHTIDE
eukprot:m.88329 g.88329  ORF g.88329 m.88329 type:complete len:475 (-) comp16430_c0_seq1:1813-3237(-)